MKRVGALVACALLILGYNAGSAAADTTSAGGTLFVVDVSGSMSGTPLEQAKNALRAVSAQLPAGASVGLRSFQGNCGDGGDLVVPVGPHDSQVFDAAVDGLVAGGGTPTPDALRAAVGDIPLGGDRTIVLISDGQSSCGDPCLTAQELKASSGVNFTVHTVGYNAGSGASNELTCIAQSTGGSYYDVTDGEGLADVLSGVVADACPDYAIFGLRGSGQTSSDSSGYGGEVFAVKERLESLLKDKDQSFRSQPINYDSLGVDSLVGDVFSPLLGWPLVDKRVGQTTGYYADSMWGGSVKLQASVFAYEEACRDADEEPGKLVMIGYSQGAAAVNWLTRSLSRDQVARSVFVTIGDPLRHSGDDDNVAFDLGDAQESKGLLQLPQTRFNTTFTPLSAAIAARTVSLCDAGDLVCDTKDALLFNDVRKMTDVHTSYADDDLRLAAVLAYAVSIRQSGGGGGGGW